MSRPGVSARREQRTVASKTSPDSLRLTYRATLVVNKPLDELVNLLGFEIPQGPHVDLAAIKADAAFFHWKPADERKTTHRYEVQLNGSTVGEISQNDASFSLSDLQPGRNYVVRINVVNSLEFRSASEPIRFHTKSASSGDFFTIPVPTRSEDQSSTSIASRPVLRAFKNLPDHLPSPTSPPLMTREASNSLVGGKRVSSARRQSPALALDNLNNSSEDLDEAESTQQQLTVKLDEIGREVLELDQQIVEDEQEAAATKVELIKERDGLRASLKEKETTSRDFKKQVSALERENTAAQNKKSAQDRALQQKKHEFQRYRDDVSRWQQEAVDIQHAIKRAAADKIRVGEELEREKIALQDKHAEESHALRLLEDEVKEKNTLIKKLEREKNDSPVSGEASEQQDRLMAQEAEEDRLWNERMLYIDEQYKAAWQNMEAAKRLCQDACAQMEQVRMRQAEMSHLAAQVNQPLSRNSSHRQRRAGSGPGTTNASSASGFQATAGPFGSGLNQTFASASPFLNIANGMTLERPAEVPSAISPADIERLTGGAMMSPGAGASLLPAGLLNTADEDLTSSLRASAAKDGERDDSSGRPSPQAQVLPGLGAFTGHNPLPGLGASQVQLTEGGPTSPSPVSSRSPSLFASPQASASNLAFYSDLPVDSDGRSIRSGRSVRATSGAATSGSRFSQILGLDRLNRQRGKTMSEESPAFGTLNKMQSQSMPRDGLDQESPASFARRRNSSHSGNFLGSVLSRGSTTNKPNGAENSPSKNMAMRRKPFFGTGTGWPAILGGDRPSSPRPDSTHSSELPRPSQDSTNWGMWPSTESFTKRGGPLGGEWSQATSNPMGQGRNWGSRHPSRRPSAQYGPSGGVAYDIMEGESDVSDSDEAAPVQAPIGTKPASISERPPSPRLNPAAKDFKSLFSLSAKKEKGERLSKGKKRESASSTPRGENGAPPRTPLGDGQLTPLRTEDELSPPNSRKSRDTRSVTTADSSAYNDFSPRNSLDRSASRTPSDAHMVGSYGGSAGKESFMQKLTRKSSAGVFGLGSFRDKKPRGDKSKEPALGEAEDDDVDRSIDSIARDREREKDKGDKKTDKPSMRSWSSVFSGKIGKTKGKNDEETPSISEASISTDVTEESDE